MLDFNHDDFPDFTLEFNNRNYEQSQPIIWLNDGKGQFETLKIGDFVAPGAGWQLGMTNHLVQTQKGYSFFHIASGYGDPDGLSVYGLVATRPYGIPNSALSLIFMLLLK